VNAAMNMMVSFVGLAGLFVFLETYFLAVLQILVYAGAIVVLFLFIIMLIDAENAPKAGIIKLASGFIALALLITGAYVLVFGGQSGVFSEIGVLAPAAEAKAFGYGLFTQYMLPFQITGFMLLIAMIGVIVISKKIETPKEETSA